MSASRREKEKKMIKLIFTITKFVVLLIVLIAIPFYVFYNHHDLIETFSSLDSINAFLKEYKTGSEFVYIGAQIIQIAIFIIPGQAIQLAGGYLFSFFFGFFLTFIGVGLGTIFTFYLARILGKDAIHLIVGEERTSHYIEKLNSKRSFTVIFIIFLIPGIPKDAVTYIAGVSEVGLKPFFIISMIGRLPSMIGSVMIGSMLNSGSYFGVVVLVVIACLAFILGIVFKDRLIGKSDVIYKKILKQQHH